MTAPGLMLYKWEKKHSYNWRKKGREPASVGGLGALAASGPVSVGALGALAALADTRTSTLPVESPNCRQNRKRHRAAAALPDADGQTQASELPRRHRPAAALPDADRQTQDSLIETAEAMTRQRQLGQAELDAELRMAVRLRSGRTVPNLQRLMARSLEPPGSLDETAAGSLVPTSGLTAVHQGKTVLVLSKFLRRGLAMCDVAPIELKYGPKGATHLTRIASTFTCRASLLQDIHFEYYVVTIRRDWAWLRKAKAGITPHEAHEAMIDSEQHLERASSQVHVLRGASGKFLEEGPVDEVAHCRQTALLVTPAAGLAHKEAYRHEVQPRGPSEHLTGITVCRASVVWDLPVPIVLDVRPWRCLTCKRTHELQEGVSYFLPQPADVQKACPAALYIPSTKDHGPYFFTARWLVFYLLVLYETFSFREARRRLVDNLLSQALASQGHHERLRVLLAIYPPCKVLRSIAMLAFPPWVERRVHEYQKSEFVYSGQAVRLDGHYKKGSHYSKMDGLSQVL